MNRQHIEIPFLLSTIVSDGGHDHQEEEVIFSRNGNLRPSFEEKLFLFCSETPWGLSRLTVLL